MLETFERQNHVELEKYGVKIELDFIGGVGDKEKGVTLTGSSTMLTITKQNGEKIKGLIDFGMFQGGENDIKYNEILPIDLKQINFAILTHTHLDHIGKTLHFSKDDFNGTIWTTKISKEVSHIMLQDAIKLQPSNPINEIDKIKNKIKNYKDLINKFSPHLNEAAKQIEEEIIDLEEKLEKLEKEKSNSKEEKIYFDKDDLTNLLGKINSINYYEKVEIDNDIQLSFINAGHLPGSAQAIIKIKAGKNKYIKIGFSGDIGKFKNQAVWGKPDISKEKLDLFVIESTYAGRFHPEISKEIDNLVKSINETIEKKGKIIIGSFMQGRAQEIGFLLQELMDKKLIPQIPIFYHSNNIYKITEIYARHFPDIFEKVKKNIKNATGRDGKFKKNYFEDYKKSAILIASGGMYDGGTIQNYLHHLGNDKNLFISAGYQAEDTLGNKIFHQGVEKIDGPLEKEIQIRAKLLNFRGFSGHGDQEDLLKLIGGMSFSKNAKIIINHGEKSPEQMTFGYAIKGVVGRTKEVLFAEFDERYYEEK